MCIYIVVLHVYKLLEALMWLEQYYMVQVSSALYVLFNFHIMNKKVQLRSHDCKKQMHRRLRTWEVAIQ